LKFLLMLICRLKFGLKVGGWRMFGTSMTASEVAQRFIGQADAAGLRGQSSSTNETWVSTEFHSTMNAAPVGGHQGPFVNTSAQDINSIQAPISSVIEASTNSHKKFQNEPVPSEVLVLNMLSSWDWNESTQEIISLANECGHTLAHVCAAGNFEELLSYLICCGIDLAKKDNQGWTAADFGAFFGHSGISRLLERAPHSSHSRSKCALYRLSRNAHNSHASQNYSEFSGHRNSLQYCPEIV
jgi:hypothetical protein